MFVYSKPSSSSPVTSPAKSQSIQLTNSLTALQPTKRFAFSPILYSTTAMPEGHTIHRVARDHSKWFGGQKLIVCSPQGRFADEAEVLSGRKLVNVTAHGKHLFYNWSGKTNKTVHIHLGLYGKFRIHKLPPPEPRGAVRVRMIGKAKAFDLNGPTRCEILSKPEMQKLLARLGQDPLKSDADPEKVWERISRSRAAIGTLLLNQSIIAGVGNVYRAEILFLLGIHPERAGNSLNRETFDELWQLTVELLSIGAQYNKIITVNREVVKKTLGKTLSKLKSSERLLCYKKRKCTTCAKKIRKWTVGARTMYACERCQK